MLLGLPRLDVNLCNAILKQSVLKSLANSMCIALYVKHVKTTPYLLSVHVLAPFGPFSPFDCNWAEITSSCVGKWRVKHCG